MLAELQNFSAVGRAAKSCLAPKQPLGRSRNFGKPAKILSIITIILPIEKWKGRQRAFTFYMIIRLEIDIPSYVYLFQSVDLKLKDGKDYRIRKKSGNFRI